MRLIEIALMIVLISAAAVFVNTIGVFDQDYLGSAQVKADYTEYTVEGDLSKQADDPGILTDIKIAIGWIKDAFLFILTVMWYIIVGFPKLCNMFGIPAPLAHFIEVGIVFMTLYGLAQWKSNRTTKYME